MNQKPSIQIKKLLIKNRLAAYTVILALGIILTIIGANISNNTVIQTILVSIGTSVIASIIILFLSMAYIFEQEHGLEMYREWGLIAIYRTRSEMNTSTEKSFIKMHESFDIVAFGMKSLRDAKGYRFKQKVEKGLKMRLLTIDPNSPFVIQREKDEMKICGEIKQSIEELEKWVNELKKAAPNPENVQLRFYDSMPLDHYCRQDDNLFIGPYLYGIEGQQAISYEFDCYGMGYEYYTNYFEHLWLAFEPASDDAVAPMQ